MHLTPYQKKQLRTIIILIIGIPLTIFGTYQAVQWFSSAGADTRPHNIIIGNINQNSVTITWTTLDKVTGSAILIENGTEADTEVDTRGNNRRNTHHVKFEGLEPGTTYEFKIISGSDTYTGSNNSDFSFSTANLQAEQPSPKSAVGQVEGNWDGDVLVYIFPKDKSAYPAISIVNSSGTWIMDLSIMRKVSDKSLYITSETTQLVVLAISGVDNGGVVEGEYGDLFNSQSELTEALTPTGVEFETYIPEEAKLVSEESQETEEDEEEQEETPSPPSNDEDPFVPPTTEEPIEEDEPFEREYELRSDLSWNNLASGDGGTLSSPQNYGEDTVMVTNLTDTTFSVIWYSQEKETGHIMYGTSSSELGEKGRDERDGIATQGEYYLHSIEVTQLQPETQYYFKVYSNDEPYDTTYEVTTFPTQSSPPQFETITGTVDAEYPESVVVTAVFEDDDGIGSSGKSLPISTLVDSDGVWILTIGGARNQDGGYFDKSSSDIVIFDPLYLTNLNKVEMAVGEATSQDVDIFVTESPTTFVKIPLLSDYGILID